MSTLRTREWMVPDQSNPYNTVKRDDNGKPASAPGCPYITSEEARSLRAQALIKFWEVYPPMDSLPAQLPPALYNKGARTEDGAKDGFLLHYGFLVRDAQLSAFAAQYQPDCVCYEERLLAIRDEIEKRAQGTLDPRMQLWFERAVPMGDEGLGTDVISLYPNGMIGVGVNGLPYTKGQVERYIQLLRETLFPFTGQEKPMWYWDDCTHYPDFSLYGKGEAWDVAASAQLGNGED